ncbi:MAG: NHL repeat-containing protein [Pirellulaceae bacterium]
MTGDSWVVPTGIPNQALNGNTQIPVAADDAGNVYLGAWRNDGSATSPDAVLTKYLPNGELDWTRDFRLPGFLGIEDVAVGHDGVYIVGSFDGTVNLDPTGGDATAIFQSKGGKDGYLAKYGADGAFLWARQWGGAGNDQLRGIAVSEGGVFVTGTMEISVKGPNVRSEHWVTSVSSENVFRWDENVGPGGLSDIAVFTPQSGRANVYITGAGESGGYVKQLIETADGHDAVPGWTYDLGANISMAGWGGLAVGTVDNGGNPLPSIYVLFQGASGTGDSGRGLLKISDTGDFVWSTSMDAYPWGVGVDGATVYVTGMYGQQADIGGTLLTSRGYNDVFLARYSTDDGQLLAAQRMGGNGMDKWFSVALGNDRVYAGGIVGSTNGDFPAGAPGEMSAFVPCDSPGEVFVMQLDTAAPIVQLADTDITVAEGTPVTLNATTSAGTIVWYESGLLLTDTDPATPEITLTLAPGVHQISAVAMEQVTVGAETFERIGMAGVVVTVAAEAPSTKFYVVDDNSANKTFEYSATGGLVESYNLNTGNTAPRGAASNELGDKTWVVDANRKVYVYNDRGTLLGSWTAGTLSNKAVVEGIATNGTDVWIVDAYSKKVYKYAGGAALLSGSPNATSSFSLNSANTSPRDIVTDGVSLWVVNDSTSDKVFKYTTTGSLVGSWTIYYSGGSPTGITLDPSNLSQDLWIVDNGTDKVYQYTNGRGVSSGSLLATNIFALAPGNTNPQGIADPPAPGSLLVAETPVLSAEADAALASTYDVPVNKLRIDTVQRSESRVVESHTRDLSYTVGASSNRLANDSVANDKHHTDVDDLFAEWDSDPLELLSFPDLGA